MKYNAISVTDLNKYIKEKIATDELLTDILVKGEISNFKNHYTGHLYFTLKDENSLIKCIMFKSYAERLKFTPKDGMKVMVFGSVSVFERDGIYLMPKVIGVLTSQTGSVIRDIINVSTRRNPNVYIRLLPVPVQGQGAAEKIAYGIRIMNEKKLADVLILARGGGSLEDLWPFNEEIVAREIYDSDIPIISAIGHETDFTISDFVADLRAPTPSAAAELAVPDIYEVKEKINTYNSRLRLSLKKKIELMRLRYEKCMTSRVFKDPLRNINDNYIKIDGYIKSIENSIRLKKKDLSSKYIELVTKLDALSPLKTLTRGYCITELNGKIINSAKKICANEEINIKFYDGAKKAKVIE